jgi:hypothetical protein
MQKHLTKTLLVGSMLYSSLIMSTSTLLILENFTEDTLSISLAYDNDQPREKLLQAGDTKTWFVKSVESFIINSKTLSQYDFTASVDAQMTGRLGEVVAFTLRPRHRSHCLEYLTTLFNPYDVSVVSSDASSLVKILTSGNPSKYNKEYRRIARMVNFRLLTRY